MPSHWLHTADFSMEKYWKLIAVGVTTGLGVFMVRRYVAGASCRSRALLDGKTVVVTGASGGIGKATALDLAKRHARVIMACRDLQKAELAAKDIRAQSGNGEVIVRKLDLASLKSVREFADRICREEVCINILINNAGVYQCPHELTEDGLEMQMAVNHFGHFLLTNLLLEKLKASVPSRIVIVSSGLHKRGQIDFDNLDGKKGYSRPGAYRASKLANNLFARELARRLAGTGVSVYCLRPGMVRTELGRHIQFNPIVRFLSWPLAWLLVRNATEGAQTVIHCAVAEELNGISGHFYANCADEPWSQASLDEGVMTKLWDVSEQLTGLKPTAHH